MKTRRRIGIVLEYEVDYIREAARGAMALIRSRPELAFRLLTRNDFRRGATFLRDMDGFIGAFSDASDRRRLRSSGRPAVNISANGPTGLPSVLTDNHAVGRLAAAYFLDRGFRSFLCMEIPGVLFSDERRDGYASRLRHAGLEATLLTFPCRRLADRLAALQKPVAALAVNDFLARRFVTFCREAGWRVPEDIAVLGVDNGQFDCETAEVPLSSIDPGAQRVGSEAVALLTRLLNGAAPPRKPLRVQPAGVVTRVSTDILAVDDPCLLHVCRAIRDRACETPRIADLLAGVAVSRRTLEKRFRKRFGRTLHGEVDRVRFERARDLLVSTSLKVTDIAERCGFADYGRFTRLFHRQIGCSPSVYRARNRPG